MALGGSLAGLPDGGGVAYGPVHYPTGTPPDEILGAACVEWFRGDSGVTVVTGNVTAWASRVSATVLAPVVTTPTPAGLGPTISAIRGRDALSADGTQNLWGVMAAALAAASRPYFWLVAAANATPASTTIRRAVSVSDPAVANTTFGVWAFTGQPPTTHATTASSAALADGAEAINTAAWDLAPHLFEYGALATATGKAVVDGTAYDGTRTGALANALTDLRLFHNSSSAATANATIAELVIASSLPDAAQAAAMRAYFKNRYALTIA